ncbi:hypothetical protein P9265_06145 [Schinkia azotoformans]|uniref:hypothetical protein n=1 Tax=Schinkia azotoformans TaxID=1454 RepID=UPI002E2473AE|nr:hypothetical protein [Schinkia azotoformans]
MKDIFITIFLPLIVGVFPAFISYFAARYQSNIALQTIKEQQTAELQKLKEQQTADFVKLREQALLEIERLKIEMDKQAELYERNAQTDVVKDFFGQMMSGNHTGITNLAAGLEEIEKLQKIMDSGTFKNKNHPAANKKK